MWQPHPLGNLGVLQDPKTKETETSLFQDSPSVCGQIRCPAY